MSAPKIKLYRLKRDFVTDNLDQDRKTETNDELLPVKDKYVVPQDIMDNRKMKGIIPSEGKFCEKLARVSSTGEIHGTLSLVEESNSSSSSVSQNTGVYEITPLESVEVNPLLTDGFYPRVLIDSVQVPRSGYEYRDGKIYAKGAYIEQVFTDIYFTNHGSSGVANDTFASAKTPVYDGRNSFFKPFIFVLKDGVVEKYKTVDGYQVLTNHVTDYEFFTRATTEDITDGDWYINPTTGEVKLKTANVKEVFLSYVAESTVARTYIAEHINWVPENEQDESGGHLYMGPDVFIGMKRYEPNSYEDPQTGQIVNIGTIPCFVDPGTYSLSHRNGSVTFAGAFDNTEASNTAENAGIAGSVHVSYANICGIENVSEQIFEQEYSYDDVHGSNSSSAPADPIPDLREGDIVFKPSASDARYLKSIDAMWVSKSNRFMPRNVYVTFDKDNGDGTTTRVTELKPTVLTIDPYDQLKVKMNG